MNPPAVPAWAELVLAPNPGPMTLEGTNTWRLGGTVVVDPGPDEDAHLTRLVDGTRLILLTHRHPDHAAAAARLHEMTGAPVRAFDADQVLGAPPVEDGERLTSGDLHIDVLHTPGHSSDSVCFFVRDDEPAVLTGDTVLGRGTTVVAHPDGRLGDYLRTLHRLRSSAAVTVLPGHGPVLPDLVAVAEEYLAHRQDRLAQVRAAVADGATEPADVVARVYADVDRVLWPAAELSVRAQLDYLREPDS